MSVLLDANILLYAVFDDLPKHRLAREWLDNRINSGEPTAMPWVSISAFIRIATNPRVFGAPLSPAEAKDYASAWLERSNVWIPEPDEHFPQIFFRFLTETESTGNLVPDTWLAALAFNHGLTVISSDTDFARFQEITWENPL